MNLALCLAQLEETQFVRRLKDPAPAYLFRHALIQDTTYASLLLKERMQLHRDVAVTIESAFAGQLDELSQELAQHYALAGELEKAISYFLMSGERATRISAYPEAIAAYQRALGLTRADAHRAELFEKLGKVYDHQSKFGMARENYTSALALAEESNQAPIAARALCGLSWLASREGTQAQAQELAERGLEWARRTDDPRPTAQLLRQLGVIRNNQGDNQMAARDLQAALELYRQLDDSEGIGMCLNSLGIVAKDQGELEAAKSFFQQALALSQTLGDRHDTGTRLINLGVIAQQQDDYPAAVRYHEEALAIAQEIGDREGVAYVTLNLGGLLFHKENLSGAMGYYRQALREALDLGVIALALYIVAAVGEVQVKMGRYVDGARLLGLAFTHPASTADIQSDLEHVIVQLRTALTDAELEEAMRQGKGLDLQAVTTEILSSED